MGTPSARTYPQLRILYDITEVRLAPGGKAKTGVSFKVSSDTPAGEYLIALRVEFRSQEANIIAAFEKVVRLIISGRPIELRVTLKQPDGSLAYGTMTVMQKQGNSWSTHYQQGGSTLIFYVTQVTYKIACRVGSREKEKIVDVKENTTVELVLSPIYIGEIKVLRAPRSRYDALVVGATIVNEDPLAVTRVGDVVTVLSAGTSTTAVKAAEITISGRGLSNITIAIAPENGWRNATYNLIISVLSGDAVLSSQHAKLEISIYEEAVAPAPTHPLTMMAVSAISGAMGGMLALVALRRLKRVEKTRAERGEERPSVPQPRFVGIHCQGLRLLYSPSKDAFITEFPDEISLVMVALGVAIGVAFETVWSRQERPSPVSLVLRANTFVFYPLLSDIQLSLLLIYPTSTLKDMTKLHEKLSRMANELILRLTSLDISDCTLLEMKMDSIKDAVRKAYSEAFREGA